MALALRAPTSTVLRIGSNTKAISLIVSNVCCVAPINFHAGHNNLVFVSKVSTKDALASFGQHLQSRQRLRHPSGNHSYLFVGACHFVTFLASTHRVALVCQDPAHLLFAPLTR